MAKGKEMVVKDAELDLALAQNIPVEPGYQEVQFPRINFLSKDITEKVKNKKSGKTEINIICEAGTFILEVYNKEAKEFEKSELGKTIDVEFAYERKQLKFYDKDANTYVSSPIYDTDEDVIPLFKQKKVIARGTATQLRNKVEFIEIGADGKKKFKLEEQKVLFVRYEGEVHQLTIRGSSSWNFSKYKKEVNIATVVTTLDSEEAQTGDNNYNKMTFTIARELSTAEKKEILALQTEIKEGIAEKNAYFAKFVVGDEEGDVDESEDDEDATDEFEVKPKGSNIKKLGLASGKKKPAF
jgi:hypothetical protein